jgi:hypothetical protein
MIKAAGTAGGKPLMLLGLSGENVTRLVAGEPISFDAQQLGFPGNIMIMYGRTEDDIVTELRKYGPSGDAYGPSGDAQPSRS